MADENKLAISPDSSGSARPEHEDRRNWTPMIVGAVVVLVAIALVIILGRNKPVSNQADPYIARLQISNLHMETAQNFAGGSVTYVEGSLANTGDRKITGARMQTVFRNSLGELVGDPVLPVMVLQPGMPIVDYGPMDNAPIGPGHSRDFRLTLEHISADWSGQMPEVKVVAVEGS